MGIAILTFINAVNTSHPSGTQPTSRHPKHQHRGVRRVDTFVQGYPCDMSDTDFSTSPLSGSGVAALPTSCQTEDIVRISSILSFCGCPSASNSLLHVNRRKRLEVVGKGSGARSVLGRLYFYPRQNPAATISNGSGDRGTYQKT